jgi:hypothetical protein
MEINPPLCDDILVPKPYKKIIIDKKIKVVKKNYLKSKS